MNTIPSPNYSGHRPEDAGVPEQAVRERYQVRLFAAQETQVSLLRAYGNAVAVEMTPPAPVQPALSEKNIAADFTPAPQASVAEAYPEPQNQAEYDRVFDKIAEELRQDPGDADLDVDVVRQQVNESFEHA